MPGAGPRADQQEISAERKGGTRLAIEARGLVKTFGETRAADGVDVVVPAGIVFGLIGQNETGKTTTIRMLATLLRPDAAHARVFGHDIVRDGTPRGPG